MASCDRCDRYFVHEHALEQHERDSDRHNVCFDCQIDFSTWLGLKEHWVQSRKHAYCQHCNEHFDDGDDLTEHYEDEHHYCSSCNRIFKNQTGLDEHYRQSLSHHYCVSCKRLFSSANALRNHMNSSIHRAKDIICPFKGCDWGFVSKSALILHLEGGRCQSGVTRQMVDRFVRQVDKTNIITNPSRLITAGDDVQYAATRAAWNGTSYECYLCHSEFRSLNSLNQHLASPIHQNKVYRCPLNTCQVHFRTLSALCQHIESEKCGVHKFKHVRAVMDDFLVPRGLLGM